MLTKSDLQQIGKLVKAILGAELFDIREKVKKIEEKIKFLPTKEEFFKETDKLYSKMTKIEEERVVEAGWKDQIENHEGRIGKIEKKLRIASPN